MSIVLEPIKVSNMLEVTMLMKSLGMMAIVKMRLIQMIKKEPNGFGLYDMSGNVYEWCWNWWPETGNYSTESQQNSVDNPTGNPTGSLRVYRGGSWFGSPEYVRTSYRNRNDPTARNFILGFRICRFL